MRLPVYDMLVNVNGIYYVHGCEQARWARSAGNSAIEIYVLLLLHLNHPLNQVCNIQAFATVHIYVLWDQDALFLAVCVKDDLYFMTWLPWADQRHYTTGTANSMRA